MVSETENYVVVAKPALLDSQNSKPNRNSIATWLEKRYGFCGLVHRLDFGTSGLMVCAKTANSARELTNLLQSGKIKRTYLAIVVGKNLPPQGTINTPIEDKEASTNYKVLEVFPNAALVEVQLETGRKHQIRKHFHSLGFPLAGDHLYFSKGSQKLLGRPALHASELVIDGTKYSAPAPEDFEDLLSKLRAVARRNQ